MMRASDTLADSRVQKPKNFLAFFSRLLPPPLHREAEKEMERKFLILLRRFRLRKEQSYFNIFVCSFLHPHGDRGASSRRLVVVLGFVASFTGRGNSKYGLCKSKNKSVCAFPPLPFAHNSPPFLGNIIKRRGLLPYRSIISL